MIKCALISLQPLPVSNTSIIGNMLKNQQGELVLKPIPEWLNNVWLKLLTALKFRKRIDIGNQKQNFIGCKGCSKFRGIIVVQDPRSARSPDKLLKLDPGRQDPAESFLSEIQNP